MTELVVICRERSCLALPYGSLAGSQFTAADILCHFPFGTMANFLQIDYSAYPNIRSWLDRIGARPAYRKAMKLAGHTHDPSNPAAGL